MKKHLAATKNYVIAHRKNILPVFLAMFLFVAATAPAAFAQVTLEINTEQMTNDMFTGANIIIAALGAVMFLLAGFKLGGILIRGIVDAIGGIRF